MQGTPTPLAAEPSRSWTKVRSDLARAIRFEPANVELHNALRAELRAARAGDYLRAVIDAAPPLTEAQRDRLARLLRPADTGGRAA